jgi:hypothetical protein
VEKLEQRLDETEGPVTRRAVMTGGAGIIGISALSGSASAANTQVGTLGSSTHKLDLVADDIQADFINNADLTTANSGEVLSSNGSGNLQFSTTSTYTDADAVNAVNAESSLSVNISGNANRVDGFSVQKNGNDTSGVINFKT